MSNVLKIAYKKIRRNYRQHVLVHIIRPFLFFTTPKSRRTLTGPDRKGRTPFLRKNLYHLAEIYRKSKLFNNIKYLLQVHLIIKNRNIMGSRIEFWLNKPIKKLKYAIFICILLVFQNGMAQETATTAGTSSILLLRFAPSPRVAGLSEAFAGLADDENALYYNPGGLNNLKSGVVSLNHTEWFEDIRVDNIIFGYDISKKFAMGIGLVHMWMPGLESKDYLGRSMGSFDVTSSVANLGFSYKFNVAFSMGVAVEYFQDKLGDYSATGFGFDAGLYLRTAIPGLTTGLVVQNLGSEVTYDQIPQKIPLTYRGGLAYKLYSANTVFALDVVKSIDTDYNLNFGVEYVFQKQFSLRAGNRFSQQENFAPSFGVGFHVQQQYNFYYTFSNYSDLGGSHRLGFTFNFNRPRTKVRTSLTYDSSQPVSLVSPANLNVNISDEKLKISWDRVPGVQYNVYARHSSSQKWVKLNKSPLYNNSLNFKTPLALGTYYFRVNSIYKGKESSYSKEVSIDVK